MSQNNTKSTLRGKTNDDISKTSSHGSDTAWLIQSTAVWIADKDRDPGLNIVLITSGQVNVAHMTTTPVIELCHSKKWMRAAVCSLSSIYLKKKSCEPGSIVENISLLAAVALSHYLYSTFE